MKVIVHKRTVKAKQLENIYDALDKKAELEKKFPNSSIEIERTSGGGLSSYRLTISTPVEIDVPEAPALAPLPYPQYPPRTPHYGTRNRPDFGNWRDFRGPDGKTDHELRRKVQEANAKVFHENKRKRNLIEDKQIAPQFKA